MISNADTTATGKARVATHRAGRFLAGAAGLGIALGLLAPQRAAAQQIEADTPPVVQVTDENGVDLVSGRMTVVIASIGIGPGGPGSITYNWANRAAAQTELFGFVDDNAPSAGKYTVTIGGATETFTLSGALGTGTFTHDQGRPSSLTYDSASGRFTYTRSDGTVAVFGKDVVAGGTPSSTPYLLTLTYPAGEKLTYHYKMMGPTPAYAYGYYWVKAITSNLGYQLRNTFMINSSNYWTISKVVLFNMANEACDGEADTCTLSGNWPSLTFDGAGSGTDNMQRTSKFIKDATNTSATVTYPTGRAVTYTLDQYERVTAVSDGRGTWTYSYPSPSGGVTVATPPGGGTPRVVNYTSAGNVTSDMSGNVTTSYTYDASNRVTHAKTGNPVSEVQYLYDSRGNVTQTRRISTTPGTPADIVTSSSYPATCASPKTCNKPEYTIDARQQRTDYAWNAAHGGLDSVTLPAAPSGVRPQTRFTYAALSANYLSGAGTTVSGSPVYRLTEMSACATAASCAGGADEVKTVTAYGADAALLPVSQTAMAGNGAVSSTATTTYYPTGDVKTIDGPLPGTADTVRQYIDPSRQLTGLIGPDPDGAGPLLHRAMRTGYNLDGQPTSSEIGTATGQADGSMSSFQPLQHTASSYDGQGRKTQETSFNGGTVASRTQWSYTDAGLEDCMAGRMNPAATPPASACSQSAAGDDRIVRNVYDTNHRVASVRVGVGTPAETAEVTNTYNGYGQPATVADIRGNVTTYEYDGFGRLAKTTFPDKNTAGAASPTDWKTFAYNEASAITEARQRDGSIQAFSYDLLGRRTRKQIFASGALVSDTTFSQDNLGRLTAISRAGQTFSYAYDGLSRAVSEAGPLGTVAYEYDAAGRRSRMIWPGGGLAINYDYDVSGALTALRENGQTSGAGVLVTFAYDNLGRRTAVQRGNGTSGSYTFSAEGRLWQHGFDVAGTAHDLVTTLTYNGAGQIQSRSGSVTAFDWTGGYNVSRAYTANGLNQLTSAGPLQLGYDTNGNLISSGSDTFQYDRENRLISASTSQGSASLAYDPIGRLFQVAGAVTTRFLYDGAEVIAEYDGNGALLRRFVRGAGADEPLVWYEGSGTGNRRWLMADERGSIVAVTDGAGAVVGANSYDPYGIPGPANLGRFQYTGQMWLPEVGLYHYKARLYSPTLGRFMQPDPIGYGDGLNIYAYVGNDPMNRTDPTGAEGETIVVTGTRAEFQICSRTGCEFLHFQLSAMLPRTSAFVNTGSFQIPRPELPADGGSCQAAVNRVGLASRGAAAADTPIEQQFLRKYAAGDTRPVRLGNDVFNRAANYVEARINNRGVVYNVRGDRRGSWTASISFGNAAVGASTEFNFMLGQATGYFEGNQLVGLSDNFDFLDQPHYGGGYEGNMVGGGVNWARRQIQGGCARSNTAGFPVTGGRVP